MSDPRRISEITGRIADIKQRMYPIVVGRDAPHRIEERPWKEVPDPSKLAILQDLNWSGVTNRDRAHILLSEIDPGKISDAQRNTLIDMAIGEPRTESPIDGPDKPLSPMEVKALHTEIRSDEHAARVRDFGQADAATYDARMAEAYRLREQELNAASTGPLSHDQRLKEAAARMPGKAKDKERGHSR